ncbi:MAG: UbiA family prenyltransferase [Chitinophagaceae bacterium]
MSFAKKNFQFFIYSNLFIALCAVAMVFQTCQFLLNNKPGIYFTGFVFFASICSYSFHWYLTPTDSEIKSPRIQWLSRNKNVHFSFFFIGLAGVVISGFYLLDHLPWLLLAAFITFLYSAPKIPLRFFRGLRKYALAKTLFLALAWMYVTTILPLQISEQSWRNDFFLFAGSRFFLIYAICILFDFRDREYDRSIGIRSLITWLPEKQINRLFLITIFLFVLFTLGLTSSGQSSFQIFLLLIPGLIVAGLYNHAKKNNSDMLYYFILDGLMAFSSVLTLVIDRIIIK